MKGKVKEVQEAEGTPCGHIEVFGADIDEIGDSTIYFYGVELKEGSEVTFDKTLAEDLEQDEIRYQAINVKPA